MNKLRSRAEQKQNLLSPEQESDWLLIADEGLLNSCSDVLLAVRRLFQTPCWTCYHEGEASAQISNIHQRSLTCRPQGGSRVVGVGGGGMESVMGVSILSAGL